MASTPRSPLGDTVG
ncbi:unnamed protein product, partial [Rotaria sp. Silwood1]